MVRQLQVFGVVCVGALLFFVFCFLDKGLEMRRGKLSNFIFFAVCGKLACGGSKCLLQIYPAGYTTIADLTFGILNSRAFMQLMGVPSGKFATSGW